MFANPLSLAHHFWSQHVKPGDWVIDATCGNGKDTRYLRELAGGEGGVIGMDIQQDAIDKTNSLLKNNFTNVQLQNIHLFLQSHETFPLLVYEKPISLIVYNLGYLPGGDKSLTTLTSTTLDSVENALPLLSPGGLLSLTCYPGHEEGAVEEMALLSKIEALDQCHFNVSFHSWPNRLKAPSLLLIQKINRN
jgi:SAM-dependent methyltransferase